jgi:hypothetical protein
VERPLHSDAAQQAAASCGGQRCMHDRRAAQYPAAKLTTLCITGNVLTYFFAHESCGCPIETYIMTGVLANCWCSALTRILAATRAPNVGSEGKSDVQILTCEVASRRAGAGERAVCGLPGRGTPLP